MKYVYGLDLSLNSTGICIFTNDGQFVECMTIDTNDLKETKLKLKRIGEDFIKIIKIYEPEIIVIEQGFTLFNSSTQAIFRVHGIANYIFSQYEQIYLPASTIKKIVGGKGNTTKEEIRDIIIKNYPDVKFKNLDESDAFSICLAYFIKEGIINNATANF